VPPFAKTIPFRVREGNKKVLVDLIVDLQVKTPPCFPAPICEVTLCKEMGGFVEGIDDLKEQNGPINHLALCLAELYVH
jgi:hypothetical protein